MTTTGGGRGRNHNDTREVGTMTTGGKEGDTVTVTGERVMTTTGEEE